MRKKKMNYKLFVVMVLFMTSVISNAEEKLSSLDFLAKTRTPIGRSFWVKMGGTMSHKRRDREAIIKNPIYIGIMFTATRTIAQVIVNNKEGYKIGQAYTATPEATVITPMHALQGSHSILADAGVRPQDLTLTFLFWQFKKELKEKRIKTRNCRVFLLSSPDKKEDVKVFIDTEGYFPLKVEWIKTEIQDNNIKKPYRTLIIDSFREVNKFYVISKLILFGPGWRTKISFNKTNADFLKKGIPKDLFRKLECKK
jgi:hypothetical protein